MGKTTLVQQFATEFDTYIYLNLEEKENASLFAADYSFDDLLAGICYKANAMKETDGRTLIFIDEIQNEPKARQWQTTPSTMTWYVSTGYSML